jgi:two-component system chemotaxis response regulator CheB
MVGGPKQTRVLIASPSPYMRYAITRELNPEPDLVVVGMVRTRDELAHKRALLRPDLIVVDLETSRELSDLEWTIAATELPVLALCAFSQEGAVLAFAALEAGAADVVARSNAGAGVEFTPDMVSTARGLARVRPRPAVWHWPALKPRPKTSPRPFAPGDCLIVISASTGSLGPLTRFLVALPAELDASVLVLSHLPTVYLDWFLDRVEPASAPHLHRARDGLSLCRGAVYFAPCDCQLLVGPGDSLMLSGGAFPQGTGPSVDLTFSSLADRYGSGVLGVILSGIGRAGVEGARDVRDNGGAVIVQEPATCLAGETPQAVIETGAATVVLPPGRITEEIVRRVEGGCRVGQFSARSR